MNLAVVQCVTEKLIDATSNRFCSFNNFAHANLSILHMANNVVAEAQLPQLTRLTHKWQFHSELDICEIKPSTMPFTETNEKLSAAIFNNAHIT